MAYNDLVLLDSIIQKRRDAFGSARDEAEVFELFSFEQLLKDFDLSCEELEDGWRRGQICPCLLLVIIEGEQGVAS